MTASKPQKNLIRSSFLGEIPQDPGSELYLPVGLPGFEHEHSLLPIEIPAQRPLVFLQSIISPDTCLVCLPVSCVCANFQIGIQDEDRRVLDLALDRDLIQGEDILCLALLLPSADTVRTNLDAPIIINLRNYRCAQVVLDAGNGIRRLTADGQWEILC